MRVRKSRVQTESRHADRVFAGVVEAYGGEVAVALAGPNVLRRCE